MPKKEISRYYRSKLSIKEQKNNKYNEKRKIASDYL